MKLKEGKLIVYTDGSGHNKTHDHGGIGIYSEFTRANGETKVWEHYYGSYFNTTTARMEVMGILKALQLIEPGWDTTIICDNQYAVFPFIKGWIEGWARDGFKKKNSDLWIPIYELYKNKFPEGSLKFEWVKGHSGVYGNEMADRLASKGGSLKTKIKDCRYE